MRVFAFLCLALLSLSFARPSGAEEQAPGIALVTFGPGETYWERFGHDAILVGDPADPRARLYNYGMFDFRQKNFFLNFARGYMQYRLAVQPFYQALGWYAEERRWAYLQRLDLPAAQRRELAAFLAWNARPENAQYRYDYFLDNCATRVRDALDRAAGGALRRASAGVPTQRSYRHEATRLIGPDRTLALLMDLGMGPRADAPIDLWQQSFVPMVLMDVARRAQLVDADGSTRPLVAQATWLLASEAWPEPERPPRWLPALAALGLAFAALLVALDRLRRHAAARWIFAGLAFVASLAAGLAGLVLLAGWSLTEHWVMWENRNLLLLDPLLLLLLPAWAMSASVRWQPKRWQRVLMIVIAIGALLPLPLLLLPGAQQNAPWIALWLPVQLALAWAMARRKLVAQQT